MEFEPTEDMLAVMAEIDADPKSKFFGRQARIGSPPALDEPLTGGEPFLTRSERKLIRAFREEHEYACYSRGLGLLCKDSDVKERFINVGTGFAGSSFKNREARVDSEVVRKEQGSSRSVGASGSWGPLDWLTRAKALIERASTSSLIGAWYLAKGQTHAASRAFSGVLSGVVGAEQAFVANLNGAICSIELGRNADAISLALRAVEMEPSRVSSRCALLVAAAKCGRSDVVREQDRQLSELVSSLEDLSVKMIAQQYKRMSCRSMNTSAMTCGVVSKMILGVEVRDKCA